MRVLFITEDDPLYVIHFFDVFFDEYPRDEFEVVGITDLSTILRVDAWRPPGGCCASTGSPTSSA